MTYQSIRRIEPAGLKDPRTGCLEGRITPPEKRRFVYARCGACSEPVFYGEDCYDMPFGGSIHEDCLYRYAAQYRHIWE